MSIQLNKEIKGHKDFMVTEMCTDGKHLMMSYRGRFPQQMEILEDENGKKYFEYHKEKIYI